MLLVLVCLGGLLLDIEVIAAGKTIMQDIY